MTSQGDRFPYTFAQTNRAFLQWSDEGKATLCGVTPFTTLTLSEAARLTQGLFAFESIPEDSFDSRLTKFYQTADGDTEAMAEGLGDDMDLTDLVDAIPDAEELMNSNDDAPVIRLINAILAQAISAQASDIHVETFETRLVIRFRIDGVLTEVLSPKRVLAPLLVSRLKVMAKLDIAEKRIPQDGRISVKVAGHAIDLRVSTLPSAHGERVVLRILDKQSNQLDLTQLSMPSTEQQRYESLLARPHGIILVTGPTGSGKTTTLYAGLSHINQPGRNIMTIEDPVEYVIPGIGQTQVHSKVGMTFAAGLRAILRQDPDVVMVGEIRDLETAEIAVQASLTGHLVLSTLHTNSAVGAISRLMDMGVEPFLLSSSLVGVMAQRLVRLNCSECAESYEATELDRRWLKLEESAKLTRSKGCSACSHTGFKGRRAIYEIIEIDDQLKQMIHDRVAESEIRQVARERSQSIAEAGRTLVLQGLTTPEEVARVVEEIR